MPASLRFVPIFLSFFFPNLHLGEGIGVAIIFEVSHSPSHTAYPGDAAVLESRTEAIICGRLAKGYMASSLRTRFA